MLSNSSKEPDMKREEFIMIRDYIHEKSGMFFAENKMYLVKNRLVKRMAELDIKGFKDYFFHVKYDTSLKEFNHLMNLMTTNETSFFRNEPLLLSFQDEIMPLIIKQKTEKKTPKSVRIWSAGCSTGEEPYTLAMIMLEKLKQYPGWNLEIIANDISEDVLRNARKGEYSGLTLRNIKPAMLEKYFTKDDKLYKVKPEVKSIIKFSHMNLSDDKRLSMHKNFDVIFCRNVMIYFSDEVKKRLVRTFYNALVPGGHFYIGHSETLHGVSKAFKLNYLKNALVYQKEVVGTTSEVKKRELRTTTLLKSNAKPNAGANRAIDLLSQIKKPAGAAK
ncbi:MAG: protein-glutamate O-methyltransferase CheR [candidate division Zixibacteria bacterium]|nr:protein-glutamate O-methyltransferase CheR [candidate division Zixibacteria bacterium]